MPSAATRSSSLRFAPFVGLVLAMVCSFASPLFAADVGNPMVLTSTSSAFVEASAALAFARTATDAAARDEAIADAQRCLEKLIKYPLVDTDITFARTQLAQVHLQAGRAAMADARVAATPAEREALTKRARERMRAADPLFKTVAEEIASFPTLCRIEPIDDPRTDRREHLKGMLIQAHTGRAEVLEKLAGTFPAGSPEARKHYEEAAERYGFVYKEYRTLIAGLVARMKQGECHYRLGNALRAQELYDELVRWPDDLKPLRPYRVRAMALRLECRNSEHEKAYVWAFSEGEEYLAHLPREEASWERRQAIRYETARGYFLAAVTPRKDGTAPPERAAWLAKAEEHIARLISD